MKASRNWYSQAFLLAAIGLLAISCSDKPVPPQESGEGEESEQIPERVELAAEAAEALDISLAKAEVRHLAPALEVSAELSAVPDLQATVGPRVAGRVLRVFVNVGDIVGAGTPLLALESAEVGDAHADWLAAQARAAVARRAAQRARELLAARVTSQRAVEEAEGELSVAEAEVEAARSRVLAYGLDPASPAEPGRVVLRSPIRGSVVERKVHVGQWIEPGDAVLEVVDLDELWLVGAVFERDLRHARVGQGAEIEVRALPGERFSGQVTHVGQTLAHSDRTAALRVVLANPGHRLRPGMFANARLEAPPDGPGVLAVPAVAVQELEERQFVFVPAGEGIFDVRWVRPGAREGDWIEIVDGLAAGEQVVAGGSLLLRGQLLRSTLGEEEGEE